MKSHGLFSVEICARVFRPRRARESPLFRLVEQHLKEFLRVCQERFGKAHGPLRSVVERVLRGFLTCGLVEHGFARLWCGTCRTSELCPFARRARNFCPSCEKKKQLLWAEWLQEEVLATVPIDTSFSRCRGCCAGSSAGGPEPKGNAVQLVRVTLARIVRHVENSARKGTGLRARPPARLISARPLDLHGRGDG